MTDCQQAINLNSFLEKEKEKRRRKKHFPNNLSNPETETETKRLERRRGVNGQYIFLPSTKQTNKHFQEYSS